MRLHRLTGLEHEKLLNEYQEKIKEIADYLQILGDSDRLKQVIRDELEEVVTEFGDDRITEIVDSQHDLSVEDLITPEERVVTISHGGYAKTQPLSDYQAQRRGGMGKSATAVKDEDFVEHLLIASTHSTILCFTNLGKVYWLKVYQIPVAGRQSRGRPMVNLLPLDPGERVTSILPVDEYTADHYIFMATAKGIVKKTSLESFSRSRKVGLRAIELAEGDLLVGTAITSGDCDVLLVSSAGKAVRFAEQDVREMGRTARGVRGIRMAEGDEMIALIIPQDDSYVLTTSAKGYGKKTLATEFPRKGRGTKGVIAMVTSERNGALVGAVQVADADELMLISNQGTMVRTRVAEISSLGRNTQGVRVIRLKDGEELVRIAQIDESEELSAEDESDGATEIE